MQALRKHYLNMFFSGTIYQANTELTDKEDNGIFEKFTDSYPLKDRLPIKDASVKICLLNFIGDDGISQCHKLGDNTICTGKVDVINIKGSKSGVTVKML